MYTREDIKRKAINEHQGQIYTQSIEREGEGCVMNHDEAYAKILELQNLATKQHNDIQELIKVLEEWAIELESIHA